MMTKSWDGILVHFFLRTSLSGFLTSESAGGMLENGTSSTYLVALLRRNA